MRRNLILGLMFLLCIGVASASIDDNKIGFWNLDNDANDCVSSYDGSEDGNPTYSSSYGLLNEGISYDGTGDGITMSTQIDINDYSEWSVSAWHYVPAGATGSSIVFATGTTNQNNYYIRLNYVGASSLWDVLDRTTGSRRVTYSDSGAKGDWTHVVLTHKSGSYNFYTDGVHRKQLSASPSTLINTFGIGMLDRLTDQYSSAAYTDEVGLWDEEFNLAQVVTLYNSGTPYDLCPSSGDACDYSGTGNWVIDESCHIDTDTKLESGYSLFVTSGNTAIIDSGVTVS